MRSIWSSSIRFWLNFPWNGVVNRILAFLFSYSSFLSPSSALPAANVSMMPHLITIAPPLSPQMTTRDGHHEESHFVYLTIFYGFDLEKSVISLPGDWNRIPWIHRMVIKNKLYFVPIILQIGISTIIFLLWLLEINFTEDWNNVQWYSSDWPLSPWVSSRRRRFPVQPSNIDNHFLYSPKAAGHLIKSARQVVWIRNTLISTWAAGD